jgi:fatty-acyl-CoA synthase
VGASPAVGILIGAVRHPDRTLLVDELGSLTYSEVDKRSNALANALRAEGIRSFDRIGLMCRDHRGFVEGVFAVSKLGADVVLLNTSFAAPQLAEVCRREEVAALLYDEEFADLTAEAGRDRKRFVVWHEPGPTADTTPASSSTGAMSHRFLRPAAPVRSRSSRRGRRVCPRARRGARCR